jgi:hypothetical protein
MTMLSMSMHPSDEALSRLADQSEIERMRSRAGRHVARCERCRTEIAAIGTLGEAARAMAEPEPPTALRERIASDRRSGKGSAPTPPLTPVDEPRAATRKHWSTRKRTAIAAAAAVVVAAVLLPPLWRRHVLSAAGPGTATMYPRYPRPGATVGIRFVPSPGWTGGDTLWVSGSIDLPGSPASGHRVASVAAATVLLRERDGSYRGRLVLPDDALSGVVSIMSASGPTGSPRWADRLVILTADSAGERPSLDALESAVYNDRYFMRPGVLADAFARWAPGHPMRWVADESRGRRAGFDWLTFFDSEERRFARLTEQLDARRDVRPAELAGMARLAYRIEEPGIAAQWTERLLREHPDDPWALDLRVSEIHQMELRGAPVDSITALVPSLDSLYPTSRIGNQLVYQIALIMSRYADSTTQRRWLLRSARAGRYFPGELLGRATLFADPQLRDSAAAFARELLASAARPLPWNGPRGMPNPRLDRSRAYATLASVALARHEYRAALALSDSARISDCIWPGPDTRALALLALGDTAAAIPYLAAYGKAPWALSADSVRRLLGPRFNPQQWQAAVDSVERVRLSCRRQGT